MHDYLCIILSCVVFVALVAPWPLPPPTLSPWEVTFKGSAQHDGWPAEWWRWTESKDVLPSLWPDEGTPSFLQQWGDVRCSILMFFRVTKKKKKPKTVLRGSFWKKSKHWSDIFILCSLSARMLTARPCDACYELSIHNQWARELQQRGKQLHHFLHHHFRPVLYVRTHSRHHTLPQRRPRHLSAWSSPAASSAAAASRGTPTPSTPGDHIHQPQCQEEAPRPQLLLEADTGGEGAREAQHLDAGGAAAAVSDRCSLCGGAVWTARGGADGHAWVDTGHWDLSSYLQVALLQGEQQGRGEWLSWVCCNADTSNTYTCVHS